MVVHWVAVGVHYVGHALLGRTINMAFLQGLKLNI
jgi:hypothetical protein